MGNVWSAVRRVLAVVAAAAWVALVFGVVAWVWLAGGLDVSAGTP